MEDDHYTEGSEQDEKRRKGGDTDLVECTGHDHICWAEGWPERKQLGDKYTVT